MKNTTGRCKVSISAVVVVGLLAMSPSIFADDAQASGDAESAAPPSPDTSRWTCRICPFRYGLTGDVLFGLGYVSDAFPDFGNFGGLEEDGVFGALDADLIYRTEEGHYLDLYAERLGLDSRTLTIEGGRQGTYSLWLAYDETPRFRADDTRTIFTGAGTANQRLPAGWVREGTTGEMTELHGSLRDIDIRHKRETLALGLGIDRKSPWRYRVDLERQKKEGRRIQGASFVFRAAELASPVDYETDRLEAAIGYARDSWELEAGYHLSRFNNSNRSVRWQNPFLGINGADVGEIAQSPDNQFHQFMLSGSWRQSRWFTLAGQFAIGRAEQDDTFLAPTLNPNIISPGLPRTDLDGRVDTRIANLRMTSNLTNRLGAQVQLRYDERDNKTPQDAFVQVQSDTFLTDARTNKPYGFERWSLSSQLDYRVSSALRFSASAERREMQRMFQEVEDTDTNIYAVQIRARPAPRLNMNLKLSREERSNDLDPALLGPLENPSLRRFHFAEKERDSVRVSADYAMTDSLFAGIFLEVSDEDLRDTKIGLSDSREERYGVNLSATFNEHISGHAFVALESVDAKIHGADNITGASWLAEQTDDFQTFGLGVNFDRLPGEWIKGSLDFIHSSADGEIRVDKRGDAPPFPELETRRYTLEASAERKLRENMNLRLGYLFGRLTEQDFFRDDVAPDSVPLLLGLGAQTPRRTVHVFSAMLRYEFQ